MKNTPATIVTKYVKSKVILWITIEVSVQMKVNLSRQTTAEDRVPTIDSYRKNAKNYSDTVAII